MRLIHNGGRSVCLVSSRPGVCLCIWILSGLLLGCSGVDKTRQRQIESVHTYLFGPDGEENQSIFPFEKSRPEPPLKEPEKRSSNLILIGKLLNLRVPPRDWRKHLGWTWPEGQPPPSDASLPLLINFWTGELDRKPQRMMPETTWKRLLSVLEKNRKITRYWLLQPNDTFLKHLPPKDEVFRRLRDIVEKTTPEDNRQKRIKDELT